MAATCDTHSHPHDILQDGSTTLYEVENQPVPFGTCCVCCAAPPLLAASCSATWSHRLPGSCPSTLMLTGRHSPSSWPLGGHRWVGGGGGPYSACFCQALAHPAVACASVHCLPLSMCVQAHAMCSFWGPLVHAIKNSVTALDEKLRTHRLEIPYQQIGSSFPSSHFLHLSHFSYPTSHVFVSHLTLPISDLTLFPPPPLTLSQGHLISTICTHAPSTLLPSHASRYGPVTSFAISAGCFVGSFVSLGLATRFQV